MFFNAGLPAGALLGDAGAQQLGRGITGGQRGAVGQVGRQGQRRQGQQPLGAQAQWQLAGHQQLHARRSREQRGGQLGHRAHQVFGVVHHQAQAHARQRLHQRRQLAGRGSEGCGGVQLMQARKMG